MIPKDALFLPGEGAQKNGTFFNTHKPTGELYLSTFEAGIEVKRIGPIPAEMIDEKLAEFLPPSWTKAGAN